MNKKYQIGQTYFINIFFEPEKMEYLGEIKNTQYNGNGEAIVFEVFRRYTYGHPDLIATYNGEFFTRSYNNSVEDLVKQIGNIFRFRGKGYTHISIKKDVILTIDEFKEQAQNLLTEEEITETILLGKYFIHNKNAGEIKWCPQCKKIRQTTCCACGCGSCTDCGYRWVCLQPDMIKTIVI